jgi:hypothetical protein
VGSVVGLEFVKDGNSAVGKRSGEVDCKVESGMIGGEGAVEGLGGSTDDARDCACRAMKSSYVMASNLVLAVVWESVAESVASTLARGVAVGGKEVTCACKG